MTAFLEALATSPNVSAACKAAGVGRTTAYDAREADPEFAEKWTEALESAVDDLAADAFKRAKAGSDVLTIFLLKSHRPEVYRESTRQEISGPKGGPIEVHRNAPDLSKLTDDELDWYERISLKLAGRDPGDDRSRTGPQTA